MTLLLIVLLGGPVLCTTLILLSALAINARMAQPELTHATATKAMPNRRTATRTLSRREMKAA